ncbi:MAG: type II secretion system F family protein [Thermoplasmata archaeon]
MESLFPDVVLLMASNLRAGMTIDRAFLLSSRKDFAPLDDFIVKAGREITTGEDVETVLLRMGERINSDKISKTLKVIISGIRAGGNLSDILELSAKNLKEKEFIEKRIVSNILMYVIFIFFAVGVGAPILFSLSSIIVGVILNLSSQIPQSVNTQINLPISFSKVQISPDFIVYYSLIFIIIIDFISSLVIGLVNKGEEKSGLKYFLPLVLISLTIFFIVRFALLNYFSNIFP